MSKIVTVKKIATEFGIEEKAARRAAEFTRAIEVIQKKAPEVAEKILLDQVPDALTELPKLAEIQTCSLLSRKSWLPGQ